LELALTYGLPAFPQRTQCCDSTARK